MRKWQEYAENEFRDRGDFCCDDKHGSCVDQTESGVEQLAAL